MGSIPTGVTNNVMRPGSIQHTRGQGTPAHLPQLLVPHLYRLLTHSVQERPVVTNHQQCLTFTVLRQVVLYTKQRDNSRTAQHNNIVSFVVLQLLSSACWLVCEAACVPPRACQWQQVLCCLHKPPPPSTRPTHARTPGAPPPHVQHQQPPAQGPHLQPQDSLQIQVVCGLI